LIKRCKQIILF